MVHTVCRPDLNDTILLAAEIHRGQVDQLGAPYYFHPLRVMMRLGPSAPDAEKHAALLHDAMEDSHDTTIHSLRERGYTEEVLTMLDLLTRRAPMTYVAFIGRIIASGNAGAMRVKLADLYDNTNAERMRGAPQEALEKLIGMAEERYAPAIAKLKLALGPLAGTVIQGDLAAAPSTQTQGTLE